MPKLLPWLALAIVAGLTFLLGRAGSRDDDALDQQTAAALRIHDAYLVRAARVDRENAGRRVVQHREAAAGATDQLVADSLSQARDLLAATLPQLMDTRDSLNAMNRIRTLDSAEIDKLRSRIAHLERELVATRADRDALQELKNGSDHMSESLVVALAAEHDARACRIGPRFASIPCPSRTTAAAIGAGLGLGIGILLAH